MNANSATSVLVVFVKVLTAKLTALEYRKIVQCVWSTVSVT